MSKEFQIRDGNLIASFDLENEDGDIDFCKLLKVSHGVADEIGMFVDYVATNKIIKDQSKQIANIEAKLAEKDRAIENWQTMYESVMQTCGNDAKEIKRIQDQLALTEKALELACEELYEEIGACQYCFMKDFDVCTAEIKCRNVIDDYFKTKAKEMMKSE